MNARTIPGIGSTQHLDRVALEPQWLAEATEALTGPGDFLAYEDGERLAIISLTREWTRIGRSLTADVRFDDATVSRRHALIARDPEGVRVLDDRSLNGVWVNGDRVESQRLAHGDQLQIGRHVLSFLTVAHNAVSDTPAGEPVGAGV